MPPDEVSSGMSIAASTAIVERRPTAGDSLAAFNQALTPFQHRHGGQRPGTEAQLEPLLSAPMNTALLRMLFEASYRPSPPSKAAQSLRCGKWIDWHFGSPDRPTSLGSRPGGPTAMGKNRFVCGVPNNGRAKRETSRKPCRRYRKRAQCWRRLLPRESHLKHSCHRPPSPCGACPSILALRLRWLV